MYVRMYERHPNLDRAICFGGIVVDVQGKLLIKAVVKAGILYMYVGMYVCNDVCMKK